MHLFPFTYLKSYNSDTPELFLQNVVILLPRNFRFGVFFNCFPVFGMLLGDTIIIDNLDAANHYRKEVCFSYSWYVFKNKYITGYIFNILQLLSS